MSRSLGSPTAGLTTPWTPLTLMTADTPLDWSVMSVTMAASPATSDTLPTRPSPVITGWLRRTPSAVPRSTLMFAYQTTGAPEGRGQQDQGQADEQQEHRSAPADRLLVVHGWLVSKGGSPARISMLRLKRAVPRRARSIPPPAVARVLVALVDGLELLQR